MFNMQIHTVIKIPKLEKYSRESYFLFIFISTVCFLYVTTTYPHLKHLEQWNLLIFSMLPGKHWFQGYVLQKVKLVEEEYLLLVFWTFFTFKNYACWYWVCFKKLCLCVFFCTEYQYCVKRTS